MTCWSEDFQSAQSWCGRGVVCGHLRYDAQALVPCIVYCAICVSWGVDNINNSDYLQEHLVNDIHGSRLQSTGKN